MMGKIFKIIFRIMILLLIIGYIVLIIRASYSFEGYAGRILDADTGEPIEEACIVFKWRFKGSGIFGGLDSGKPVIIEAVSDREGKFEIPQWGPNISLNPFRYLYTVRVTIFKPEYKVGGIGGFGKSDLKMYGPEYVNSDDYLKSDDYKKQKEIYVDHVFKLKKHDGSLYERGATSAALTNIEDDDLEKYAPYSFKILEEEDKKIKEEFRRRKKEDITAELKRSREKREQERLEKREKENQKYMIYEETI